MTKRDGFADRFWAQVRRAPGGCRRYEGRKLSPLGYALCWDSITKRRGYAHRFAYELAAGDIPPGGCVAHTCPHKWCVEPAHLRLRMPSKRQKVLKPLPRADHPVPRTDEYRAAFWSLIDRRGPCWIPKWYLPRGKQAYVYDPSLGPRRKRSAHFIAYELEVGPVPPDHYVRPTCGTTACVRPEHLGLMNHVMLHQGKPKLALRLLTPARVRALRAARKANPGGTTLVSLANTYKIAPATVAKILAGTLYADVTGGAPIRKWS